MRNVEEYRKMLTDRLNVLTGRLEGIADELSEPGDQDFEERATEREGDEVLERLGTTGLIEIQQIKAALKRIEDDSYGYCLVCGDEIPEARLNVVPHAPTCVRCAERRG